MSFFTNFESYTTSIADGKVTEVALSHRGLDDESCRQLAIALTKTNVPQVLDLQSNHVTSNGVHFLCDGLRENQSVQEINLDSNEIDDAGAEAFIQLLATNVTIRSIHLNSNRVSNELLSQLAFQTSLNTQPQELKAVVAALLANDPSVTVLELIDVQGLSLSLLRTILQNNTQLQVLKLCGVAVGDPGCEVVGNMIHNMSSLTHLDLSRNSITLHGVKHLCDHLKPNTCIRELVAQGNKMSDDSARLFVDMLRVNDSILHIDVEDNAITNSAKDMLNHSLNINRQPLELKRAYYAAQVNDPACERIEFPWVPNMQLSAVLLAPVLKTNHVVHTLNLSNARFGDAGAIALANVLKHNKTLTCIEAANNDISDEGGVALAQALCSNTTLIELNLANNQLGDAAGQAFANTLMNNTTLQILNVELNCMDNQTYDAVEGLITVNQQPRALKQILPAIEANSDRCTMIDFSQYDGHRYHTDASARVLCNALRHNMVVTSVDISNNIIGDEGALCVAQLLLCKTALDTLAIAHCSIGDRGGVAIANALASNTVLADLDLEDNCLGEETGQALLDMLNKNDDLAALNVDHCRIGEAMLNEIRIQTAINTQPQSLKALLPRLRANDETITALVLTPRPGERTYGDSAVQILCSELEGNDRLTDLDLSDNHFGIEGLNALSRWIAAPTTKLAKLSLAGNRIGDDGISVLCEAFAVNQTLKDVNLKGTRFTQKGLLMLIEALKPNDSITNIDYTETNDMARKNKTELVRQLILNTQSVNLKRILPYILDNDNRCTEVSLRGCGESSIFGDTSTKLLSLALAKNTVITAVDLSDNDITSEGIEYLADMLEDNKSITSVNLANNRIDDRGANALSNIMAQNDTITMLDLSGNAVTKPVYDALAYAIQVNNGPLPFKKVMSDLADNLSRTKALPFTGKGAHRQYNDESVLILCSLLVENTNVDTIDLSHNQIGDRGAQLVADTLRVNSNITKVDLSYNGIGPEGGQALFLALKVNCTLVELNLEGNAVPKDILENLEGPLMINRTPLKPKNYGGGAHKNRKKPEQLTDEEQFKDTEYMHLIEEAVLEDAENDHPALKDFQRADDRERRQVVLSLVDKQKKEREDEKIESPMKRISQKHEQHERNHLLGESPLRNMLVRQKEEN